MTRALAAATGMTVRAAHSVVVVWGPFPQRIATSGESTYVTGEHLHDWLLGQRACLNRTQLEALSAANTSSFLGNAPSLVWPGVATSPPVAASGGRLGGPSSRNSVGGPALP
jgi:hypothetical protein